MALNTFQIEASYKKDWNPGVKRYFKNQLVRKIRRVPSDQLPDFKYKGW